jgi:hypothetical protein
MQRCLRAVKKAVSAAVFAVLAACGGGGSDPFVPSVPSFEDAYDIGRILFMLLTGSGSWTVAGVGSDGALYEMTIRFEPDSDAFFPLTGLPGASSNKTVTLRRNGVVIATVTDNTYYDRGTLTIQGSSGSDGSCSLVTSSGTRPSSAAPGSGGALDSSTDYVSCTSGSAAQGNTARTWSIETEGLTVFFCSNETSRDLAGTVTGTESVCLQVSRDGSLGSKAHVTRSTPGGLSLTARNFP